MQIDARFLQQWQHKGHVYGECMSHPDSDLMYIHIPKNASSWTKPNLKDFEWQFYNYHTDSAMSDKTAIVVLRDPVQRWISGMAEYLSLYHSHFIMHDLDAMDLIFDRVCFDDHTERQINFLHGIDTSRCIFLRCDHDYRTNFAQLLRDHGMPNTYQNYEPQHVSDHDQLRRKFRNIMSREIVNPAHLRSVQAYFEIDYELINSVDFYEAR